MANTELIKSKIHPYVRNWLEEKYSVAFGRSKLLLRGCEGIHYFDAVSSDGKIAAEIKTASGRTSGGKHPSGKRASAFEQLYFLSLAKAELKLLVLTDPEFFEIMKGKTAGIVPGDIQLLRCPLPPELTRIVFSVTSKASEEIDRGKTDRSISQKIDYTKKTGHAGT
jgi:hypothetical protein